jgi:hypothetical protein
MPTREFDDACAIAVADACDAFREPRELAKEPCDDVPWLAEIAAPKPAAE